MTTKDIFNSLTDKEATMLYELLKNVFETYSHFYGFSDDEIAMLAYKIFGEHNDDE